MYSIKKQFLFIHVPKTAGNSIQNILKKYSEEKIVTRSSYQDGLERFEIEHSKFNLKKHSTLNEYQRVLPSNQFSKLFKFAAIRNPWERAISFYFSPHRGKVIWNKTEFIDLIKKVDPITDYITIKSRKNLIFKKNEIGVDYIIRFEKLEEDFEFICQKLEIPFHSLPTRNRSEHRHYSYYYDDHLIELVGERFKNDIELGEYKF